VPKLLHAGRQRHRKNAMCLEAAENAAGAAALGAGFSCAAFLSSRVSRSARSQRSTTCSSFSSPFTSGMPATGPPVLRSQVLDSAAGGYSARR
jgi:hypothetical protein